jgi:SAM-dependent MidA family methyltransferase
MNPVESVIRQEILATGNISFARFMEIALYCPKIGYYERSSAPVGRRGDYYTSVSVGPLFGELLACQFAAWLSHSRPGAVSIIEAGAHDGQLALDILTAFRRNRPDLAPQYGIVEPSSIRRQWQRAKLDVFAGHVTWFASLDEIPEVSGILFSNELLDAMPVHVLRWRGGQWLEAKVSIVNGQLAWCEVFLEHDLGPPAVPAELAPFLPDGFQIEVSPAARRWWQTAARKLHAGNLVTFDYGGEMADLLSPHRTAGTLRAYHHHQVVSDVLANPGEQDLTAHVNFAEIKRAGESVGLKTECFASQEQFLARTVPRFPIRNRDWNSERVRQFQTLTHPDHLGRAFKVLVQSR